jgi:ribonuclease P protein component
MDPLPGRFGRADRLLRSSEFQRVTRCGKRAAARYFVVIAAPCEQPGAQRQRLGVTVSRRVGNAVIRNRVKRRIREWFRAARHGLTPGIDVVVIARKGASELSTAETGVALGSLMEAVQGNFR